MTLLVACSGGLAFPDLPFPSATAPLQPTATATTPDDYPSAASTAIEFVQALNQQDYLSAFNLLDQAARDRLQDADSLRQSYASARSTATAVTVFYTLRGGMLQEGGRAVASLVSTWQTTLLGTFNTTSTLVLNTQGDSWRVDWTGDLILPQLGSGVIALQREMPQRGNIYAADGSALAVENESMTVGVRRDSIKDAAEEQAMLQALSQLTGLTPAEIQARYKDVPGDWFAAIADLDEDTLARKSSLIAPFAAVSARPSYTRVYPQGNIAPHVVGYLGPIPTEAQDAYRARGYTGDERVGISGVEGYMDDVLAGEPGAMLLVAQPSGGIATIVAQKPYTPGRDLTLTISPTVQLNAQKLLGNRNGAVVVMDPRDGAILAMASYPTFNSATLADVTKSEERARLIRDSARPLLNRATQGIYPPGSTFKLVTMMAGMTEGVTKPGEIFNDPGFWDGLGKEYRKTCWIKSGHGRITLQDGLSASCDVVFYSVGKRLDDKGSDLLSRYGLAFGFGTPSGVELTSEAAGVMPDPAWKKTNLGETWTAGDTVNLSIGQGFMLATPLQVAQMTAAVANRGTLLQPHIVASIEGRGRTPRQVMTASAVRKLPVSNTGLEAIQNGMIGVTTNTRIGTTTFRFSGFDYYIFNGAIVNGKTLTSKQRSASTRFIVAGKSGTAQAPGEDARPFAWFTAYAPAHDPQVVVTVLLENAGEGSIYAAPLVRQIIEAYFGLPISTTPRDSRLTD
ncbi:MAG: penicillin-binding protein 2 [Chloroflexi bacterium]|nr:penicillin-binding protein 2 [Chloroflexota bacterium]